MLPELKVIRQRRRPAVEALHGAFYGDDDHKHFVDFREGYRHIPVEAWSKSNDPLRHLKAEAGIDPLVGRDRRTLSDLILFELLE